MSDTAVRGARVMIVRHNAEPVEIEGAEVVAIPGLVLHPDQDCRGGWVITHAFTGRKLPFDCESTREAMWCLHHVDRLVDWTKPIPPWRASPLAAALRATLKEMHHQRRNRLKRALTNDHRKPHD